MFLRPENPTCTREDCNTIFEFAQVGRLMISEERRAVQLAREVDMFRCFERGPAWGCRCTELETFTVGFDQKHNSRDVEMLIPQIMIRLKNCKVKYEPLRAS